MKKLLGALAVSAALTGTTFASPFTDVPSSHWAYGAINDVVASGIMKGYRGGMFKGNETVNRYEMAIIVSRLMKKAGGKGVGADVRRTMDRLGEEFMDELDLIGARLTALENAFHEHVTDGGDAGANGFAFSGEARVRWENQTEDLTNTALKDDDSRWQGRTLLNVEKSVDRADFFVQLQYDHTFGNGGNDANNADINQAWVDFSVTDNANLKLGRQAVEIGNGAIIGRHDHLQNPYSYDGWILSSSYDDTTYNLWSLRQVAGAVDTDLHGLDVNFTDVFDGDLHVHYYHFTGLAATAGNNLDTYGFDWTRDYDEWNFYVQYAAQSGDQTAAIEYDGELLNLAVGYDVDEDDKIGLSYTSYSGNDTATAASNEGWQHLNLGDAHNFLGYADVFAQSNIEDITFTWDRQVDEKNSFHLAYHMFELDDSSSDAAILNLNGWTGLTEAASTGANDDDLGTELDLIWKHQLSNDVGLALGYAMFDAGDYFTTNKTAGTVSPDATYAWLTANVKF